MLASVEKMTRAYNVQLLGIIEKPVTPDLLNEQIVKYTLPKQQLHLMPNISPDLDQILHGIEQKQFEPFFQPQMEIATGRIVGAEALARWRHPELGLINPYAFISTLEQSGNIDKLTMLMLEKAAIACHNWCERGLELQYPLTSHFAR